MKGANYSFKTTQPAGVISCDTGKCVLHYDTCQLNGNNGEWTNGDDLAKKMSKQNKRKGKSPQALLKRDLARTARKAARRSAVGFASNIVGNDAAKSLYGMAAKSVKMVKHFATSKQLVLSDVASTYLKSYIDPFSQSVRGAHIPTTPSFPTYKVTGFVRGVAYIGTQGVGYVAMAPTIVNDLPSVYYTSAAYAQTVAAGPPSDVSTYTGNATTPAFGYINNLPYSSTQITATGSGVKIEGRIVSAGFKVEYTGTELNRSGLMYAYTDPDGDNLLGDSHAFIVAGNGMDVNKLSTKEGTEISSNGRKGCSVVILPPNSYSLDFTNQNATSTRQCFPYSTGDNMLYNITYTAGAAPAIIMFTGVPGQSVYFEAVIHVEYEGAGVTQSLLTESSADVVGLDAVQNILSRTQRQCASDARKSFKQVLRDMMKFEKVKFGTGRRSVDY